VGRRIAIIGAGVAGLSAGCYSRMNGYESTIYEMHDIPGGLCTSWKRGPYTFDGCIDWLTGSAPDGMFHPLWREVGAVQDATFHYEEEYCRYLGADGQEVVLYLDPDRLERELLRCSPEDSVPIGELCTLTRRLKGFRPNVAKAMEVMGPFDYLAMMADVMSHYGQYGPFLKYGKVSMADFARRFSNAALREMLMSIWNDAMPVSLFASTMAWCSDRTAGYPRGGSLKLAREIEKRYLALGGRICYRQRVTKVLVKDGRAAGLVLADGTEVPADMVISAADGHAAIYELLDGRYVSDMHAAWHRGMPTFPGYLQVSLGVKRDLRGQPRLRYWKMDRPLVIAGRQARGMIIHNYSFDPTLAPGGKTPLVVRFFTQSSYWEELAKNRVRYRAEKDALATAVIDALETLHPGIAGQVEVRDVATPATYTRYTGTWRGATMSWLPTTANFGKSLGKTLPGLSGFYMAGQWLVPGGGLPNALKTARDAVQMICRKDGKRFTTTEGVPVTAR
jgi:phytoene dehydrogenase-like protein